MSLYIPYIPYLINSTIYYCILDIKAGFIILTKLTWNICICCQIFVKIPRRGLEIGRRPVDQSIFVY